RALSGVRRLRSSDPFLPRADQWLGASWRDTFPLQLDGLPDRFDLPAYQRNCFHHDNAGVRANVLLSGDKPEILRWRRRPGDSATQRFCPAVLDQQQCRLYYFSLATLLATLYLSWRFVHSRFGRVLRGARSNVRRMSALGFPVLRYQLV